jgi:DNA-binding NtrC family response regulator
MSKTGELLMAYNWSGNFRELRHMIQNLLFEAEVQGTSKINEALLPLRFKGRNHGQGNLLKNEQTSPKDYSNAHQLNWSLSKQNAYNNLKHIENALIHAAGRKEEAAIRLGMENDQNLRYRVISYHRKYPELFEEGTFPTIIKGYKLLG